MEYPLIKIIVAASIIAGSFSNEGKGEGNSFVVNEPYFESQRSESSEINSQESSNYSQTQDEPELRNTSSRVFFSSDENVEEEEEKEEEVEEVVKQEEDMKQKQKQEEDMKQKQKQEEEEKKQKQKKEENEEKLSKKEKVSKSVRSSEERSENSIVSCPVRDVSNLSASSIVAPPSSSSSASPRPKARLQTTAKHQAVLWWDKDDDENQGEGGGGNGCRSSSSSSSREEKERRGRREKKGVGGGIEKGRKGKDECFSHTGNDGKYGCSSLRGGKAGGKVWMMGVMKGEKGKCFEGWKTIITKQRKRQKMNNNNNNNSVIFSIRENGVGGCFEGISSCFWYSNNNCSSSKCNSNCSNNNSCSNNNCSSKSSCSNSNLYRNNNISYYDSNGDSDSSSSSDCYSSSSNNNNNRNSSNNRSSNTIRTDSSCNDRSRWSTNNNRGKVLTGKVRSEKFDLLDTVKISNKDEVIICDPHNEKNEKNFIDSRQQISSYSLSENIYYNNPLLSCSSTSLSSSFSSPLCSFSAPSAATYDDVKYNPASVRTPGHRSFVTTAVHAAAQSEHRTEFSPTPNIIPYTTFNSPLSSTAYPITLVPWSDNPEANYDSSSPDELALIAAAKHIGAEFVRRPNLHTVEIYLTNDVCEEFFLSDEDKSRLLILREEEKNAKNKQKQEATFAVKRGEGEENGKEEEGTEKEEEQTVASVVYDALEVLEFDNFRKRMSIIIRDRNGELRLLTKGADSSMLDVAADGQEEIIEAINKQLADLATRGMRTLVLGSRLLSEEEFRSFRENGLMAKNLPADKRDAMIQDMFMSMEREIQLAGCTGIEDKLQDMVPETILDIKSAGVKLWVLTGDKMETAISIGHSCNLLTEQTYNAIVHGTSEEQVKEQLRQYMSYIVAAQLASEAFEELALQAVGS